MSSGLSEREERILVLLDIRDAEAHRCAWEPEHDGDVIAGLFWERLGVYWRPSLWELELRDDRTQQQSWSHTLRRLREKKLVGSYEEPREVVPHGALVAKPTSYYWLTKRGEEIVPTLKVPADLRRRCRYDHCDRWLPPTEPDALCHRCRFSRKYRENGDYKKKGRGPGFEEFVSSGFVDVVREGLLTNEHATEGMRVAGILRRSGGMSLAEGFRQWLSGEDGGPVPRQDQRARPDVA